mmetsp:Transcript_33814/g.67402  ORF Transcript_33814/g.67402 Transcript_33814/m.67402 type:complete len:211 (-) Transcript_33814:75-707(-)
MRACVGCPAGSFQQLPGQSACEFCLPGHYCLSGAAAALPCKAGTWSNATDLTSKGECTPTAAGYFSTTGSSAQSPCRPDTYNPLSLQINELACRPCPPFAVTAGRMAQATVEQCVCATGYYRNSTDLHDGVCVLCPSGTACSKPGSDIFTLPIKVSIGLSVSGRVSAATAALSLLTPTLTVTATLTLTLSVATIGSTNRLMTFAGAPMQR